jgi:hypothetical protein
MRNIRINIEIAKNKNHKTYTLETVVEEFLKDSGILISTDRRICPKSYTPYINATILDEDKFSKYISENELNYEIL